LKRFLLHQFPAIAWTLLIFYLSSLRTLPVPQVFHWQDKVEHAGAFFILCFFIRRAFFHQAAFPLVKENAMTLAVLVSSFYGVLDEIHQLYVPGRSFDYWDMAADATGAGVCALAFFVLRRWQQSRRSVPAVES
jgi:VanZ family protein